MTRVDLLRPYQQFHQQAARLQETLNDLRITLDRQGLTEEDIKLVEDQWVKMQQQYHHLSNVGKAFIETAQNVSGGEFAQSKLGLRIGVIIISGHWYCVDQNWALF